MVNACNAIDIEVVTPTSVPDILDRDLDNSAEAWAVFPVGSPTYLVGPANVTLGDDDHALQCSITGGAVYSGAHCYRNLPAEPAANIFTLSMAFQFSPETTCNNQGTPSVVQAIEFSMSKWDQGLRYEWAVQWENVGASEGDGAPQWRYWDGSQWVSFTPKLVSCVPGNKWHTLTLSGHIINGQVQYDTFIMDAQAYSLNIIVPAIQSSEPDKLAVAVQVNSNAVASPYDLFINQVNLIRQ